MLDLLNMTNFGFLILLSILYIVINFAISNKKVAYLKSTVGDLPKEFIEKHIALITSLDMVETYEVLGFDENSIDVMIVIQKALNGNGYRISDFNKNYDFSMDYIVFYLIRLKNQTSILMILSDIYEVGVKDNLLQSVELSDEYLSKGLLRANIK